MLNNDGSLYGFLISHADAIGDQAGKWVICNVTREKARRETDRTQFLQAQRNTLNFVNTILTSVILIPSYNLVMPMYIQHYINLLHTERDLIRIRFLLIENKWMDKAVFYFDQ